MALIDFWSANKEEFFQKHVKQVIAIAGDGTLRDGGTASREFRDFLGKIPQSRLDEYAHQCLEDTFEGSGFALQDVVNEMGRRLGFAVTDGNYRGRQGTPGQDGLWELGNGHKIVVEVKTTDAYAINLDTPMGYRKSLVAQGVLDLDQSSTLIVVGRKDTGGLEAQIRGSRYAWDIRIISVDALVRLMTLKESLDDPSTISRIAEILVPREYTKVDQIIDLVFATAEDVTEPEEDEVDDEEAESKKPKFIPVKFHAKCAKRLEDAFNISLINESRSKFRTVDGNSRYLIAVSKLHGSPDAERYWFAFHPHQREWLAQADDAYLVFGCASESKLFVIPFSEFEQHLDGTWTTEKEDRMYWHVRIEKKDGHYYWDQRRGVENVELDRYLLRADATAK